VLTGTATAAGVVTQITQTFINVPLDLLGSAAGRCDILNLDLGPLNLDLLGLQVDLSAINLDIVAQSGPGKLLGNLLCAWPTCWTGADRSPGSRTCSIRSTGCWEGCSVELRR
jgi:hypothetical protein